MLKDKANLTEPMKAGRILSKGIIDDLTTAFSISGEGFSICVIPTADITDGVISEATTGIGLIVNCRLINEDSASDFPIYFNQWTEANIKTISAGAINLTTYTVYYGAYRAES